MTRIKLDLPLDPRMVDAAQTEIQHMVADLDEKGLSKAADDLVAQSEKAIRTYPRDAGILSDLGRLARVSIEDVRLERSTEL